MNLERPHFLQVFQAHSGLIHMLNESSRAILLNIGTWIHKLAFGQACFPIVPNSASVPRLNDDVRG